MLSAIVGVVVMAAATAAMVFSVQLNEQSFSEAGQQSLNQAERDLLANARYGQADIDRLEGEIKVLPNRRP